MCLLETNDKNQLGFKDSDIQPLEIGVFSIIIKLLSKFFYTNLKTSY